MFTGIVESIGEIKQIFAADDCIDFVIAPRQVFSNLSLGESIAVNGVCLTVTDFTEEVFYATAVPETLRVTNLAELKITDLVNLERSLTVSTRLGGHFVQGHIDTVGEIIDIARDGAAALIVKIALPRDYTKYIIKKGYVTLDGMSITVIEVTDSWFSVTFIPHTQAVTIAHQYQVAHKINIEVDMLGKYIEKLMGKQVACNLI